MNVRQTRNATLVIEYGGKKFIIDPWFRVMCMSADSGFAQIMWLQSTQLDDFPPSSENILDDIDAIIVTHTGDGCFDYGVANELEKKIPVFTRDEIIQNEIKALGFENVSMLSDEGSAFFDITLYRTQGRRGELKSDIRSTVCGVVMDAPEEKTLYIAGDTIFYDGVAQELYNFRPEIIVLNACGAVNAGVGRLIMDATDVVLVAQQAPYAQIVVCYMEDIRKPSATREKMYRYIKSYGVGSQVMIPDVGERMFF